MYDMSLLTLACMFQQPKEARNMVWQCSPITNGRLFCSSGTAVMQGPCLLGGPF